MKTFSPFPFFEILAWRKKNGRHYLPWRKNITPYHVWISEIFLQQTQAERVGEYYLRVIKNFPTLGEFSCLSYEDFFPFYQGLGYYSRAKNMLQTAKIVQNSYNGIFPDDYNTLLSLPGIGPYTAKAILAFGYNRTTLAFDTNLLKIFSRFYYGSRFHPFDINSQQLIEKMFCKTKISARDMNSALMDFACLQEKNTISGIDFSHYLLKQSVFYKTKGKKEIQNSSHKESLFNNNSANIVVILHTNHIQYFSSKKNIFSPFILPKTKHEHRAYIKMYFQKKYHLAVSVRPFFKKVFIQNIPYIFYYTQIQIGEHTFTSFSKEKYQQYIQEFIM